MATYVGAFDPHPNPFQPLLQHHSNPRHALAHHPTSSSHLPGGSHRLQPQGGQRPGSGLAQPSSSTMSSDPNDRSSWHPLPSMYLPTAASSSLFDPAQPLLLAASALGTVSTYFCNPISGLTSRYTSYSAHQGPVGEIAVDQNGILSVGGGSASPSSSSSSARRNRYSSIKMANRRGLTSWTIETDTTMPLTTFAYTPARSSEIVTTGPGSDMFVVNLNRGSVVRRQATPSPFVHLRRSTHLVASTTTGSLVLLDARTSELSTTETVLAHTGGISQLEVEGNYILTIGYTMRQGLPLPDPYLKLHDARFLRPLSPIPFPTPPALIKFHPRVSGSVFVASAEGRVQMLDLKEVGKGSVFQIDTPAYLSSMAVSPTGQGLALTDTEGYVHLWSAQNDSKFLRFETEQIELPDVVDPPERIHWNDQTPLNSIGMPYYSQPLLSMAAANNSDLRPHPLHHRKPILDPALLASVKQVDFVGYAAYPPSMRVAQRRNQVPKMVDDQRRMGMDVPMFRSDRERAAMKKKRDGVTEEQQALKDLKGDLAEEEDSEEDKGKKKMPNHYRKVEIQYSRFGVEDFDFGSVSPRSRHGGVTPYSGLETHITNSYTNSLLQALHYTTPVKTLAEAHTHTSCPKENCLLCEAGFLFRMLGDAKGMNCQASNFSRAFGASPQGKSTWGNLPVVMRICTLIVLVIWPTVSALGLMDHDNETSSTVAYASLIQTFSRYLLEQMSAESNVGSNAPLCKAKTTTDDASVPSPLAQLLRIEAKTVSVCSQCGSQSKRDTGFSTVDLLYPRRALSNEVPPASDFTTLLRNSIHRETIARMVCSTCRQPNHLRIRRVVAETTLLPPVLVVNAGVRTSDELEVWMDGSAAAMGAGSGLGAGGRRRFLESRFEVRRKGEVLSIESSPKEVKERIEAENGVVYELRAMVVQIQSEGDAPHLVALARGGFQGKTGYAMKHPSHAVNLASYTVSSEERNPGSSWHVFNDFLVRPISEDEALSFPSSWKIPAVLFYQRVDSSSLLDFSALPLKGDPSILCEDITVSKNRDPKLIKHQPLRTIELPHPGTLISIDAEFVSLQSEEAEFHSDGTKKVLRPSRMTLARVSVLRGEGEDTGIPFIDDHIHTSESVVDYLTEFSGIQAGDLDPFVSRHTLVPLKVAYKKLRMLVDLGCVFIGHGLNKDFRIINIYIPPSQIIDTVNIYHLSHRQRKLSLRFLAWAVLKLDIQSDAHDSIEDARTALQLYEEYYRLEAEGTWEEVLEEVYRDGKATTCSS
ncbi:BZ3500_MvSof-1268-A1-R1_Chr3-1g05835 [Microbotryum saponariae]|uniref:PAN2-PAN3 deadenylation complex catalytic subunit PAN2 n=1 Tax=Microbotryum saponariae TaxID=289078 RepID=A0A2X0LJH4_9BASI|nr:BZ3500_MvSof-1268-A1-R1_Chr3-1g05835 [Microbotryum saponariae]SDA05025.1 BZ3501_MvSof-1269-A2-R1_Chr3-1g05505 [Microbotryum saponariae]